jgi:hypothetical protein
VAEIVVAVLFIAAPLHVRDGVPLKEQAAPRFELGTAIEIAASFR